MSKLRVRKLGYAIGAEITGVDLRKPLDEATIAEIRRAWLDHIMLCYPGQDLSEAELIRFTKYFGEIDDNRAIPSRQDAEFKEILRLQNRPIPNPQVLGPTWHTDYDHTQRPSTGTLLLAKELPPVGGNTAFSNTYMAYETLSPKLREIVDGLEAVHDVTLGAGFTRRDSAELQAERRKQFPPIVHPVARTHPETGRRALYLGNRVRKFVGMSEEETKPLLEYLNDHTVRYEFVYRHAWSVGDLLMWDNRAALHYAIMDFDQTNVVRRMIRTSLIGPKQGYVYSEGAELAAVS
jgi:taurine dioxygenase